MSQSIYRKALGSHFTNLHPELQKRIGFSSEDGIALIGRGVMDEIWHAPIYTLPTLHIGTRRNVLFPEQGRGIPFTIENYAYVDSFGRETMAWIREFHFPQKTRRFDATMVYSHRTEKIIDYLGTHQNLVADIEMFATEEGGLRIRSGAQRFYADGGVLGFRVPMLFSGAADVHEWYNEQAGQFHIEVRVNNPVFGLLFRYRGTFQVEYKPIKPEEIPLYAKPVREEGRE